MIFLTFGCASIERVRAIYENAKETIMLQIRKMISLQ
jgi:hypothetical protein